MLRVRAPLIPPIDFISSGAASISPASLSGAAVSTVPQYNGFASLSASASIAQAVSNSTIPQYNSNGDLIAASPNLQFFGISSVPQYSAVGSLLVNSPNASGSFVFVTATFSAKLTAVVNASKFYGDIAYIWDKPMSEPCIFNIKAYNNENLEIPLAFPWILSQWPLPNGSYFDIDIRSEIDDAQPVLSFASENSPRTSARDITLFFDRGRRILIMGIFAPQSQIANLSRAEKYLIDVRLTRPRGSADPRVDIIGKGFISILKGVTRG